MKTENAYDRLTVRPDAKKDGVVVSLTGSGGTVTFPLSKEWTTRLADLLMSTAHQ